MVRRPRLLILAALTIALSVGQPALAEPTVQQLQGLYDDALRQLQQSQDRKNELANENEQLKTRLAELEQRVRDVEAAADPAYAARARGATWEAFVESDPIVAERFAEFDSGGWGWHERRPDIDAMLGRGWPLAKRPSKATTQATTLPTTLPTPEPTTQP